MNSEPTPAFVLARVFALTAPARLPVSESGSRDGSVDVAGVTASDPAGTMRRRVCGSNFGEAACNAGVPWLAPTPVRHGARLGLVPQVPCDGRRPAPHQRVPVVWRPSRTGRECPDIELCG